MAFEYRHERRVEFGDTDMAGIAHFSWFFRYAEEAEHAFYRSLGLSLHGEGGRGPFGRRPDGWTLGLPRAAARMEFLKPLSCEDLVEVHIWVRRKGSRSIVYQLRMSKGGETVSRGEVAVICCQTQPDGRIESTPLPPELADRIEEAPYPPLEFRGE